MARYWVYVHEKVGGPYSLEQLIRLRGFSRQTQVCLDQGGTPGDWVSPAQIPELAHIFAAADQPKEPAAPPKPARKPPPPPRPAPRTARETPIKPVAKSYAWAWVLSAAFLTAGGFLGSRWFQQNSQTQLATDRRAVADMIDDHSLPSSSEYSSLRQYRMEKGLDPRWVFEKTAAGLWNVTLSWSGGSSPEASTVYGFEVNPQAQSLHGLNSAAMKLLAEGFPRPAPPPPPPSVKPKPVKPSAEAAANRYADAVQKGNFADVWDLFSDHKRSSMTKAGISQEGFVRLQTLTHKLEQGMTLSVLKTKKESEDQVLALLKQTQDGRPDVFMKQTWVLQEGAWKLDGEEKKAAEISAAGDAATTPSPPALATPAASGSESANTTPSKKALMSLPGISN